MELRRTTVLVVAFALGALLTARAVGATELESFERRVGKSAAEYSGDIFLRSKGACVCMSSATPGLTGAAGVLRRGLAFISGSTRVSVDCWVPWFGSSGEQTGAAACYDFVALPK
jgi:hypothetical protein